jgi:hypothetical protein
VDYLSYAIACGGLILVAFSFIDLSAIAGWFKAKGAAKPSGDTLREYVKIRSLLVSKLDAVKVADVDKVVLDEVTGGAGDGK